MLNLANSHAKVRSTNLLITNAYYTTAIREHYNGCYKVMRTLGYSEFWVQMSVQWKSAIGFRTLNTDVFVHKYRLIHAGIIALLQATLAGLFLCTFCVS